MNARAKNMLGPEAMQHGGRALVCSHVAIWRAGAGTPQNRAQAGSGHKLCHRPWALRPTEGHQVRFELAFPNKNRQQAAAPAAGCVATLGKTER